MKGISMTNSEFIAGLIGPVLLAMAVSVMINRSAFEAMISEIEHNMLVIVLAGLALLVAGLAIVRVHNIWDGWEMIITVAGWLAVIGGLIRILFAPRLAHLAKSMASSSTLLTVAMATMLLVGLFLTGKGYGLI